MEVEMKKKTIVGIAGRRYAGKDTAAAALIEDGAVNVKFAGGIKVMLRAYLSYVGVRPETIERMIEGDLKEMPNCFLGYRSPRYAMQTLGTEWGRNLMGDTFWIDSLTAHIEDKPFVVVTDMRFPNEVEHVKRLGGATVRIVDPDRESLPGDEHASESQIDGLTTDYVIQNPKGEGMIEGLHKAMRAITTLESMA